MPPPPAQNTISCTLAAGAAGSGGLNAAFSWQGAVAGVHEVRCTIWHYEAQPGGGFAFVGRGWYNNPNALSVGNGTLTITGVVGDTYVATAGLYRNGQLVASSQTGYVTAP